MGSAQHGLFGRTDVSPDQSDLQLSLNNVVRLLHPLLYLLGILVRVLVTRFSSVQERINTHPGFSEEHKIEGAERSGSMFSSVVCKTNVFGWFMPIPLVLFNGLCEYRVMVRWVRSMAEWLPGDMECYVDLESP